MITEEELKKAEELIKKTHWIGEIRKFYNDGGFQGYHLLKRDKEMERKIKES